MHSIRKIERRLVTAVTLLTLAGASRIQGKTTTWSAGAGDWETGAGWSDGKPGNGDHALIEGGNVLVTNATAELASLEITGGTLTFSNWSTRVSATNIQLTGGAVDLPAAFTNLIMSNRIWFACSTFFLGSGAAIDASESGYSAAPNGGAIGYGPGGADGNYEGAGHGGKGGVRPARMANDGQPDGGEIYGSTAAPLAPGSGGGGGQGTLGYGGHGGGAVLIDAGGAVTINGTINANAGNGQNGPNGGGGGSGGSIYIQCSTFGGTNGLISANGGFGGPGNSSAGGAGGRISVVYTDAVTQAGLPVPDVVFSVAGGVGKSAVASPDLAGEPGTLYFPDNTFLTETLRHRGQWMAPGLSEWTVSNLLISNGWIRFPTNGFKLSVLQNLTITGGSDVNDGRLDLLTGGELSVGGNALLTNGACITVHAAPTNGMDYGADLVVTGKLTITGGSMIYAYSDATNGGSTLFRMQDLVIRPNSGFNADGGGFSAARLGHPNGYGPGGGTNSAWGGSGAGYGGVGGAKTGGTPTGGATYGSDIAPALAGSGGCARNASANWATAVGHGGGLVRIEALGTVSMNGTISANGWPGGTQESGGSGGGVFLSANAFSGSGLLRANGGNGGLGCGGGGGGRIAVWYGVTDADRTRILAGNLNRVATNATYSGFAGGDVKVDGATGGGGTGEGGSIVFLTVTPPAGTLVAIR